MPPVPTNARNDAAAVVPTRRPLFTWVLLTYSRANHLTRALIANHLLDIYGDAVQLKVAQEHHADGGLHFHAMVHNVGRKRFINTRTYDVAGIHPNISPIKKSPGQISRVAAIRQTWEYIHKEDAETIGNLEEPAAPPVPLEEDLSPTAAWGEIISQPTREAFINAAAALAPRDWVVYYERITSFADRRFREPSLEIPAYPKEDFTNVPDAMVAWIEDIFRPERDLRVRPRALVLVGGSKLGKTQWACAQGTYWDMGTNFNLDNIRSGRDLAIFNDCNAKDFPNLRDWLGGQLVFDATDKYRHKSKITKDWKGVIWTCNQSPLDQVGEGYMRRWLTANTLIVNIEAPLYTIN